MNPNRSVGRTSVRYQAARESALGSSDRQLRVVSHLSSDGHISANCSRSSISSKAATRSALSLAVRAGVLGASADSKNSNYPDWQIW
jgi:hypothetical protein